MFPPNIIYQFHGKQNSKKLSNGTGCDATKHGRCQRNEWLEPGESQQVIYSSNITENSKYTIHLQN